jgi:hypothetical protein
MTPADHDARNKQCWWIKQFSQEFERVEKRLGRVETIVDRELEPTPGEINYEKRVTSGTCSVHGPFKLFEYYDCESGRWVTECPLGPNTKVMKKEQPSHLTADGESKIMLSTLAAMKREDERQMKRAERHLTPAERDAAMAKLEDAQRLSSEANGADSKGDLGKANAV